MWVKEIWRYPVKSMAGESLESAEIKADGVDHDRLIQVRDAKGRVITSRTRPQLLMHKGTLDAKGNVLVDGQAWNSPKVAEAVREAAGPETRLVEYGAQDRFDILPLIVETDGTLDATGYDRRRFRPNIVIGGVEGLAERTWEGGELRIGSVRIGMEDLRTRCIMTTFDPDSGKQDIGVLKRIRHDFNGRLGLNSYVIAPGTISVGDKVEVVPRT